MYAWNILDSKKLSFGLLLAELNLLEKKLTTQIQGDAEVWIAGIIVF